MFEPFKTEVHSLEAGNIVWLKGVGRITVHSVGFEPVTQTAFVEVFPHARYHFGSGFDRVDVVGDVNLETVHAEPGAGFGGE